jgi:predicted lipoprotein with Yx(FWY)xxD motif
MKRFATRVSRPLPAVLISLAALATLVASPVQARGHDDARAAAPIKTTSAHVLVNRKGMTLYVFAADPKGKSTCSGECAKFWPPLLVKGSATPAAKMAGVPGTFGVITRADGKRQMTYDGAPLYTFLEDKSPGQMNGQGVVASGGYWWVVVAAGK